MDLRDASAGKYMKTSVVKMPAWGNILWRWGKTWSHQDHSPVLNSMTSIYLWDLLTSFQFFRKNLRVLSSPTLNPKRRKHVLFFRSTTPSSSSSSPLIWETMKLSSTKMFSSSSSVAVFSLLFNQSTRTEGKSVCASRDSNQLLLLLLALSSSYFPNDNTHLQYYPKEYCCCCCCCQKPTFCDLGTQASPSQSPPPPPPLFPNPPPPSLLSLCSCMTFVLSFSSVPAHRCCDTNAKERLSP